MRRRFLRWGILCGLIALAFERAGTADAATFTWNGMGGDNNWSTGANWAGGTAPTSNLTTTDLQFAGTTRPTPNADTVFSTHSLAFNTGTDPFTIGGMDLTTGTGGIINNSTNTQTINNNIIVGASQTWIANSGNLVFGGNVNVGGNTLSVGGANNTTLSGNLTGTGAFRKIGGGTVTMSGNNNGFSGPVTITAGTLRSGSASGLPGNVQYTINGGQLDLNGQSLTMTALNGAAAGQVFLNNANLTVNSTADSSYSGALTGTGSLTKSGTNRLDINGTANDYTGSTTINGGTLGVAKLADGGSTSSIGQSSSAASNLVINGGTLSYTGSADSSTNRQFTMGANGGTLDASGASGAKVEFTSTADITLTGVNTPRTLGLSGSSTGDNLLAMRLMDNGTGASSLTKSGNGNWILTANHTYTGETTLQAGRLQIGDGGTTGSIDDTSDVNLTGAGATLAFDRSDDIVFDQVIMGSGGLEQMGAGKLTLTKANTYTGTTLIDSGTLQVGDGGTAGTLGTGAVTDNGTLIVNRSDTLTLSNNISGSGVFTQQGTGTTILSGTNSYTGGTNINHGILQGTTNSLQGAIHNGAMLTFDQSFDGAFDDVIDGLGAVNKNGTGAVTFSGANTYTGATNVNAGELVVNGSVTSAVTVHSGATLSGIGTTGNVDNQGTTTPGNATTPFGTMNVSGTFNNANGATTEININDTLENSKIAATGDATLQGGTVHVIGASGTNYKAHQTYTFLTANSVTGTYSNATADGLPTPLLPVLGYTSDTAFFTLLRNGVTYESVGRNFNQRAVGGYLDQISSTATGDLQTVFNAINPLDDAEFRVAMSQMSGAIHGTLGQLGVQNTNFIIGQIGTRLRASAFYPGCCQDDCCCAVARRPSGGDDGSIFLARYMADCDDCAPVASPCQTSCWTGWGQGFATGGSAKSDGNAEGIHYSTGGAVVGIERWLDCERLMGFYGGYAGTDVNTAGPHQNVNGGNFGGYLYNDDGFNYWTLMGGFEFDGYATHRLLSFDDIQREASANYTGWQGYAYAERGFSFRSCTELIQPFAALQYIYLRQNPFSESGADSIDLVTSGTNTNSLRSLLGLRLQDAWVHRTGRRSFPEIHAYWLHEYLDSFTSIDARFAGTTAGSGFVAHGLDMGRDWAVAGTNFTWEMPGCWTVAVNYDLQANTIQVLHLGSVSIGHAW